jgi:hypothetical protein
MATVAKNRKGGWNFNCCPLKLQGQLDSSFAVAYFYDVGSTYVIDQQINHLHNDRVANMWRNNVPSVCGRG